MSGSTVRSGPAPRRVGPPRCRDLVVGALLMAVVAASCGRGGRDPHEVLVAPPPPGAGDDGSPTSVPFDGGGAGPPAPDAASAPEGGADSALAAADAGRVVEPLPSLAPLIERIRPSVVNITTEVQIRQPVRDPWGRRVAVPRSVPNSLGSGFLIDAEGHVLTNGHVVRGASSITVQLDDGRETPARLVGFEPRVDLAVLDIDLPDLRPLELGDSDAVRVGDYVVAVGNPLGLSNTVTAGIISAVGREVQSEVPGYADFLQTDASINQGNSGGPLVDLAGRVVGINTAVSAEGQGIGFAVPINMVKHVLPQILERGTVTRSWLGLYWRVMPARTARDIGLEGVLGVRSGWVWVDDVVPDSPAAAAGILPNDVVVSFGGEPITRISLFPWVASTAPVGRPVPVVVWRDGRQLSLVVVPQEVPE